MSLPQVIDALNRLLALHARSLPVYLTDARPWVGGEHGAEAMQLIADIAADHAVAADRLGALVVERDGVPDFGEFPLCFTGWHDLSLDFLLDKLIQRGERAQGIMQSAISQLTSDAMAQAVAEELLGEAIGHIDSLREVQQRLHAPAAS